ncbi:hypothetical protein Ancab_024497 [Ancistrocladus abbreviatus]
MEENDATVDEWRDFVFSPKEFPFISESCQMREIHEVAGVGETLFGDKIERELESSDFNFEMVGECENGADNQGIKSAGSIAERRAAKFGFNAGKINTNTLRFRFSSPLASPAARSPCLTIPPGISPTALLDSPMMLPNSQSSPTTGTLVLPPTDHDNPTINSASDTADGDKDCDGGSSFWFKPHAAPLACFFARENKVSSTNDPAQNLRDGLDHRTLASVQPPMEFEFPARFPRDATTKNFDTDSPSDTKMPNDPTMNADSDSTALQWCHPDNVSGAEMRHNNESTQDNTIADHSIDGDQKGTYPSMGGVRTSEDGYNWRKYGQKQVKGSEYPRSYYKCTHPHCLVKKKVERSHDGQITEIIYKGAHNHPKPHPSRRSTFGLGLSFSESSEVAEGSRSCVKPDGGPVLQSINYGCEDIKVGADWRADGLERTSSTSVLTEISDPMSITQGKRVAMFESVGTSELSSTLASHEDNEEDAATQGSLSLGDEDDNETDSKKRTAREPRVVVQIESEVDILDDGYRWRKYGQKVVKGNPNPRSYYKCTSAGCTVRKHVERASHNLKCVITTYEGKHNHEVPAAKNSGHTNSSGGNLPPTVPNSQASLTLPRGTHLSKHEPHDLGTHFDRKMVCNNECLKPAYLANFGGASSFYQMKFPPLPGTTPYGSFGLSPHNCEAYPTAIIPAVPDISMPLPLRFPHSSNLAIANYHNHEIPPFAPLQALYSGQELKDSDVKLLRPKQEEGDDTFYDTSLSNMDRSNPSLSSLVYPHIIAGFPTRPSDWRAK